MRSASARRSATGTRPRQSPAALIAFGVEIEERRRAQALVDAGPEAQRQQDQTADVGEQRPERAVRDRVPAVAVTTARAGAARRCRTARRAPSPTAASRFRPCSGNSSVYSQTANPAIKPGADADAAGAAPVQPADDRRRELRERDEREQADRGELHVAGRRAVVRVGQRREHDDRDAPHGQHDRGQIARRSRPRRADAQQRRHDQVVADHRRQRDATRR